MKLVRRLIPAPDLSRDAAVVVAVIVVAAHSIGLVVSPTNSPSHESLIRVFPKRKGGIAAAFLGTIGVPPIGLFTPREPEEPVASSQMLPGTIFFA
jgi:hypothetical protein